MGKTCGTVNTNISENIRQQKVNQPLFSVVIPTHSRPGILAKTLDCLEKQNTSIAYEVIVVDDRSTIALPDLGFAKGRRANCEKNKPDQLAGKINYYLDNRDKIERMGEAAGAC
jgi:hypothetical protein